MVFNALPWLLSGSSRPEYALKQAEYGDVWLVIHDLDTTFICLVCIVAARLAFNYFFSGPAARLAAQRGKSEAHRDGPKLMEEVWVLCGNLVMLSMASFVMLHRNGGCNFSDLKPCLSSWPNHSADKAVTLYYALELAWYTHLLLKPVLKYGQADGRDMMAHHFASLALLLASCGLNLTRMGVVALSLFGISNPALHGAKIANQLNAGRFRMPAFGFFALVFFVTRVVLVPFVILVPALVRSRQWMGHAVQDFHSAYVALNVLLWVLYGMQLVWMLSIVRVLRRAAEDGTDAASKLSAAVDPAKRYSEVPQAAMEAMNASSATTTPRKDL